jgi:DNA-binding response OmpR family regulator
MSHLVLIVDDEKDLVEMYQDFLESEGIKTISATSGEEALKICNENQNITLVVSDSHMGKMSGIDLFNKLKETRSSMPLFYLSTGDMNKSESDLKKVGINRLILKPFDLDELLLKIKEDLK